MGQKLTLHHQVFEDVLEFVQGLRGHLILDRLLMSSLTLSKQAVCA